MYCSTKRRYRANSNFSNQYHHWSNVEAFEIPLPPVVPTQIFLEEISTEAEKLGMKVFCEVTLLSNDDWKEACI